jgi:hypothetical protein
MDVLLIPIRPMPDFAFSQGATHRWIGRSRRKCFFFHWIYFSGCQGTIFWCILMPMDGVLQLFCKNHKDRAKKGHKIDKNRQKLGRHNWARESFEMHNFSRQKFQLWPATRLAQLNFASDATNHKSHSIALQILHNQQRIYHSYRP